MQESPRDDPASRTEEARPLVSRNPSLCGRVRRPRVQKAGSSCARDLPDGVSRHLARVRRGGRYQGCFLRLPWNHLGRGRAPPWTAPRPLLRLPGTLCLWGSHGLGVGVPVVLVDLTASGSWRHLLQLDVGVLHDRHCTPHRNVFPSHQQVCLRTSMGSNPF